MVISLPIKTEIVLYLSHRLTSHRRDIPGKCHWKIIDCFWRPAPVDHIGLGTWNYRRASFSKLNSTFDHVWNKQCCLNTIFLSTYSTWAGQTGNSQFRCFQTLHIRLNQCLSIETETAMTTTAIPSPTTRGADAARLISDTGISIRLIIKRQEYIENNHDNSIYPQDNDQWSRTSGLFLEFLQGDISVQSDNPI